MQTSMPQVGFEPTITVFDRAATVIGITKLRGTNETSALLSETTTYINWIMMLGVQNETFM
jgi:hypothetical protein